MRNSFLYSLFLALFFFSACNETSKTVVSVADDFSAIGNGKMVATVENAGDKVKLSGSLELEEGIFTVYLSNPDQDTIFTKVYSQFGKYKIDEEFDRMIGEWVFSYTIEMVNKTAPAGVFDFDITYND